jgi:hypothetical protein
MTSGTQMAHTQSQNISIHEGVPCQRTDRPTVDWVRAYVQAPRRTYRFFERSLFFFRCVLCRFPQKILVQTGRFLPLLDIIKRVFSTRATRAVSNVIGFIVEADTWD